MVECTLCGKETDKEYALIKAKYTKTHSKEQEQNIPLLERNYRSLETDKSKMVGENRHYLEKVVELKGGLCSECMALKRKQDSWFKWYFIPLLIAGGLGLLLKNIPPIARILSLFLFFMTLVGQIMTLARAVSHTDKIRAAEVMEGYFLDKEQGGDGTTITLRDFLYRPVKNPDRFILFGKNDWEELNCDSHGTYLSFK